MAESASVTILAASLRRTSPAGVRSRRPLCRLNSGRPTSDSRSRICWLKDGCATRKRRDASDTLSVSARLDANPDDELANEVRARLASEPERYAAYTRDYLGWGVMALMPR
jgi:hypothetical protein